MPALQQHARGALTAMVNQPVLLDVPQHIGRRSGAQADSALGGDVAAQASYSRVAFSTLALVPSQEEQAGAAPHPLEPPDKRLRDAYRARRRCHRSRPRSQQQADATCHSNSQSAGRAAPCANAGSRMRNIISPQHPTALVMLGTASTHPNKGVASQQAPGRSVQGRRAPEESM
jgi:hypothetical protein